MMLVIMVIYLIRAILFDANINQFISSSTFEQINIWPMSNFNQELCLLHTNAIGITLINSVGCNCITMVVMVYTLYT